MPPHVEGRTQAGSILGYSLMQDDAIDVAVIVGNALTQKELAVARWLEPQTAYLRVPSGKLCVESNDASRLGPEKPGDKGAVVNIPPADYRVTLYRIDHESLDREGLAWSGPQEVIVFTPGGAAADAANGLLPFEPRRDNSWVGKYTLREKSADVLVWFADSWDTFVVNIDSAAASKLRLDHGAYIRTLVPQAGITLLSAFAPSWDAARRLPLPPGADHGEYGYAAFSQLSDWNGAEALFCRRDTSKTRIEDQFQTVWLAATIEIETAVPQDATPGPPRIRSNRPAGEWLIRLRLPRHGAVRCVARVGGPRRGRVAGRAGDVRQEVQQARSDADRRLELGRAHRTSNTRLGFRVYTGAGDCFAALLVAEGIIQVFFLTEFVDGKWIATGLIDDLERFTMRKGPDGIPQPNPLVRTQSMDEALPRIFKAHAAALKQAKAGPRTPPGDRDDAAAALQRFLGAAFGSSGNPAP